MKEVECDTDELDVQPLSADWTAFELDQYPRIRADLG